MGGVSKDTAIAHSTLRYNLKYKYCPHSIFFYFSLCTIINIYLYLFSINMYLIILKVQFCVGVFNVYNHLYLLQISLFLKKDNIFLKIYPMIITFCVSVQECLHALPRKICEASQRMWADTFKDKLSMTQQPALSGRLVPSQAYYVTYT